MIAINNLSVSTSAPAGTVVGTLSLLNTSQVGITATFQLSKGCAGLFATSGYNIITLATAIPPGNYAVKVRAVGSKTWWKERGSYVITVTP